MTNLLGAYGAWAAALAPEPARLSFRRPEWRDLGAWRSAALDRLAAALLVPDAGPTPPARVERRILGDGLEIEFLSWQLPWGPPTEALLLKPVGARGPLPGVLALHDHAGDKAFGARKIVRLGDELHPHLARHQERSYGGVAWANELARRGYVVLVHDVFPFGSRRIRPSELPPGLYPDAASDELRSEEEILGYNRIAALHEQVVAKSLFCAGTTLAGTVAAEDRQALDQLCARPEVDARRVGCCGLSGGGLRAVHLAALDERIACACCVGMMTTWRDFLLNTAHKHTWMVYAPGLPQDLDYPEILAIAAPRPTLVLSNRDDALFTLPEMERAHGMLADIYAKAGAAERHRGRFHAGPHKFDLAMQAEAFAWLDRWLGGGPSGKVPVG
ncbi:MAG TPA: hypothetical protein VFG43_01100 [Geminicoccaceae bacterium]|nr:hypothetical protein [Geminicoccaceae bacterium]